MVGAQGEAIAFNLREMFGLRVPIFSVVIGEGGSGGALAIGCANRSIIMEHAVYYVASPEACAAILWKSRDKAATVSPLQRSVPALLAACHLGATKHLHSSTPSTCRAHLIASENTTLSLNSRRSDAGVDLVPPLTWQRLSSIVPLVVEYLWSMKSNSRRYGRQQDAAKHIGTHEVSCRNALQAGPNR